MIFPDVSLESWMKKYPELDFLERTCEGCGKTMKSTKPFLMTGYAGLISEDCPCKGNRSRCSSRVTINSKEHARWAKLLDPLK